MKSEYLRNIAIRQLKQNGYDVTDISTGSGIPKHSRLEITMNRKVLTCAVRLSLQVHGRISFPRTPDGKWDPISDYDRVLYLHFDPSIRDSVRFLLFDAETVVNAFQETYEALEKIGSENYQVWLSPVLKQKGTRFLRSGFANEALIDQTIPIVDIEDPQGTTETNAAVDSRPPQKVKDVIEDARIAIARILEIEREAVELEVRFTM